MTLDRHSALNIFLTGGTGLLGSHLLEVILNTTLWDVIALKRPDSDMSLAPQDDRIHWINGQLNDIDDLLPEVQKCSLMIHAAGALSVQQGELKRLLKVNGKGTGHMVDLALAAGVDRFVHVSSVAALGREKDGLIHEDDHFIDVPIVSDYARSKYAGDKEAYRGMAEGLSVNIIRPSLILGAGHWNSGSDAIVPKIAREVPFYPIGGTGVVDVRDVARMTLDLAVTEEGSLDVICSGHNMTWENLNQDIAKVIGARPPDRPLPSWLEGWIWRWERFKSLFGQKSIISRSSLERARKTYFYDASKSRNILGFEYLPIEKTLHDLGEAYKKYTSTGQKRRLPSV